MQLQEQFRSDSGKTPLEYRHDCAVIESAIFTRLPSVFDASDFLVTVTQARVF